MVVTVSVTMITLIISLSAGLDIKGHINSTRNKSFYFNYSNPSSTLDIPQPTCDGIVIRDNFVDYLYPAGVCAVTYEESGAQYSSIMQCNKNGTDLVVTHYTNLNCSEDADHAVAKIDSFVDEVIPIMDIGANYSISCEGVACDYIIRREYPTTNCDDDIETVKDEYSDTVLAVNQCMSMNAIGLSIMYTHCQEGELIEYDGYLQTNCNGKKVTTESQMEGECNDDGHHVNILCGTAVLTSQHVNRWKRLLVIIVFVVIFILIARFISIRMRLRRIKKKVVEQSFNYIKESVHEGIDAVLKTNNTNNTAQVITKRQAYH